MEFLGQVLISCFFAGVTYGGIRSDLKSMHSSITRAHERIDNHLDKK